MSPRLPLSLALALCPVVALAEDPSGAEPLKSRIGRVTVYSDRAQVVRTSTDALTGTGRYVFTGLPGWVDADSVRVALAPMAAGRVLDVSVETRHLAEASSDAVREAEAKVRETADAISGLDDELKTLADEVQRLEAIRAFRLDSLPKDLQTRDVPVKALKDTLGFVTEALRADRAAIREFGRKRRDLVPVLAARQRELAELTARTQLRQTAIVVEVELKASARLELTYMCPGATWEPTGDVRVASGAKGDRVEVSQVATVIQTTGEDWSQAELAFSTQSPGDVLDIPTAHGLLLDGSGEGLTAAVGKAGESFNKAQMMYAEDNEKQANKDEFWRANMQRQQTMQTRAAGRFAELRERGTTAHFKAMSGRTVRTDGKPVRVPIALGTFDAARHIVAVPEVSLNAVATAALVNGGTQPILPGTFALFVDGAFVGTSEVPFVAPGEKFTTFLGMVDQVKLERVLDKKSSALSRRGKRTQMTISHVVTAQNLGAHPLTLDFSDRVPVSRTDEIEVDDVETPKDAAPDSEGLIRWTETLAPGEKRSWRISYTLDYPTDFVARYRAAVESGAMPAPAPAKRMRSLEADIEQFESTF